MECDDDWKLPKLSSFPNGDKKLLLLVGNWREWNLVTLLWTDFSELLFVHPPVNYSEEVTLTGIGLYRTKLLKRQSIKDLVVQKALLVGSLKKSGLKTMRRQFGCGSWNSEVLRNKRPLALFPLRFTIYTCSKYVENIPKWQVILFFYFLFALCKNYWQQKNEDDGVEDRKWKMG